MGHKVEFTPAYHSDLQPIELVWALVKGAVGRQYTNETTLELVYQRLLAKFKKLELSGHDSIQGMIDKCSKLVEKFYSEMDKEAEAEEDADEEEEADATANAEGTDEGVGGDDNDQEDQQEDTGETGGQITLVGGVVTEMATV